MTREEALRICAEYGAGCYIDVSTYDGERWLDKDTSAPVDFSKKILAQARVVSEIGEPSKAKPGPRTREKTLLSVGYALRLRDEEWTQEKAAEGAAERFSTGADYILAKLQEYERSDI